MEELQRRSQPGDVPVELIQRIQSLLPLKEAARTCVLSKTWSHAWSTIPNLRFDVTLMFRNEENKRNFIQFMDRTISKYVVQDNIPIQSFDLRLTDIKLDSLAYKWLRTVAAQSCFKELYIHICYVSDSKLILPDEMFFGKKLHTLCISDFRLSPIRTISVGRNPVINCVSLKVLKLYYVEINEELLDMIKSKLPSLEILDLVIQNWTPERLNFTSLSLKRLTLQIRGSRPVDIQVYAPKLHNLSYRGQTMPSLLFPSSNALPEYIKLELDLWDPVDHSFNLRMREQLDLSSKFDIIIRCYYDNIDVDDHEIRFPIPSTNVQQLYFYTESHVDQKYFYTLLTIFHPKYVTINCSGNEYSTDYWFRDFFEHMKVGIMAKKTCNIKDIEFKNRVNGKWEILTDSCITAILDTSDGWYCSIELKPNW